MGISGFCKHQAFAIPSTYRLALKGYEAALNQMTQKIKAQYGDGIHILTPHLLTRSSIMTHLMEQGILR